MSDLSPKYDWKLMIYRCTEEGCERGFTVADHSRRDEENHWCCSADGAPMVLVEEVGLVRADSLPS